MGGSSGSQGRQVASWGYEGPAAHDVGEDEETIVVPRARTSPVPRIKLLETGAVSQA